jgi:hypothetical protein
MAQKNPQADPTTGELPFDAEFELPAIDVTAKARKLTEVYEELAPSGTGIKAEDLVGHDITVRFMKPFVGRFIDQTTGKPSSALWCVLTDADGTLYNTVFGGKVLCEKLWAARANLPVEFKLVMQNPDSPSAYYDAE